MIVQLDQKLLHNFSEDLTHPHYRIAAWEGRSKFLVYGLVCRSDWFSYLNFDSGLFHRMLPGDSFSVIDWKLSKYWKAWYRDGEIWITFEELINDSDWFNRFYERDESCMDFVEEMTSMLQEEWPIDWKYPAWKKEWALWVGCPNCFNVFETTVGNWFVDCPSCWTRIQDPYFPFPKVAKQNPPSK